MSTVEKMKPIANKHDASVHQIALSWLLHHSPNILLIPGTSSVEHLEENVAAKNISLDEEDMQTLDGLA
jgi:aryl-alcohol dehydrogenase-like predicted oxidoreductase